MSAGPCRVDLPRGEVPLTATSRIGVIALRMPDGIALWVGEECRSDADQSIGAFTPTDRGFRVPAHLADAVAGELRVVARRASEVALWAPAAE